jgi:hypothetical protein
MPGSVLEGLDLRVLRREIRDRIADQAGERERPSDARGGEVADGDFHIRVFPVSLKLTGHRGRQLDPVHANTPAA